MWLPGYERWELPGVPGVPYDEPNDPKAVAHTTEGSSISGAVQAYRAYPPHLIVDPWVKRKVQHVDLDRAAYALWNADADDSRCIQIEIVGFAAQTHLWPDDALRWLGEEVARPLHEYAGVPYRVVWKGFKRDGETGYALATSSSPLRLTQAELDGFSGWLGHQHIPGDSHWDPGGLNVPKILAYAANQEEDMLTKDDGNVRWRAANPFTGAVEEHPVATWIGLSTFYGLYANQRLAKLEGVVTGLTELVKQAVADDQDVDLAAIEAAAEKGAREGTAGALTALPVQVDINLAGDRDTTS